MKKTFLILLAAAFVMASCGTSKGAHKCDAYGDLNDSDTMDLANR